MMKKYLALTPLGKYVAPGLVFVMVLVFAYGATIAKTRWDVWRAGIHSAQKAEDKARGALEEGKGALDQASDETRRVLEDYARAQQAISNLSQQILSERKAADDLRAQLAASQAQRKAQPLPTTLKGVADDLATYSPAYRSAGR